jgi:hypothetical protein
MFERIKVAPAVETVTVEEQCLFSRIDVPGEDDGGSPPGPNPERVFIESCITTAREQIELIAMTALISQRWTLTLDHFPGQADTYQRNWLMLNNGLSGFVYPAYMFQHEDAIELLRRPVQEDEEGGENWAALTVKYLDANGDEQTFDSDNYIVFADKITLKPGKCWPAAAAMRDAVRIEYPVGYGDAASDVPERLKTAVKYLAGHFYDVRNPVSTEITNEVALTLRTLLGGFLSYRIAK